MRDASLRVVGISRQEPVLLKQLRGAMNDRKRKIGALRDIEQRMRAIGQIENPQHSHLPGHRILVTADSVVETPFTKLRFT